MGYPTIPSNCRREQQSTRYLSLKFRVGILPHSTLSDNLYPRWDSPFNPFQAWYSNQHFKELQNLGCICQEPPITIPSVPVKNPSVHPSKIITKPVHSLYCSVKIVVKMVKFSSNWLKSHYEQTFIDSDHVITREHLKNSRKQIKFIMQICRQT